MSKYSEMKEYLEARISQLEKNKEHYRNRYMESGWEKVTLQTKCNIYEKLLNKFMGDSDSSDEFFMFEGKLYQYRSSQLSDEPGKERTLNVDFVEVPIPENV